MATIDYTGKVLEDRYVIIKILGQGGMGSVYLGKHNIIGRQVAVKFLHSELANNEEVLKRFYREAQAAAAIGHKNIIEVMDVGVSKEGDPYLVMEYLEGEDLDNLLDRTGPLDLPTVCGILEQTLLALSVAHEKGIVHRDLKPANIFLVHNEGEAPSVKLIDFGISKFTEGNDKTKLTQTGSLLGTPAYMAPEQARGSGDVDFRADIYSMGVILYQMLTGQLPFKGENYNDLLINVLTEAPKPPKEAYGGFPMEAEALVNRMLSKDPNGRPGSALEALKDLNNLTAFDKRHNGMTQLSSEIRTQCCASGDLGDEVIRESQLPSATGILENMKIEGTPDAWSGMAAKSSKNKFLFIGIGGGVAIAAVILTVVFLGKGEDTKPTIEPIASPQSMEQFASDNIQIEVKGLPEGAELFYDKASVPMNPFTVKKGDAIVPFRVEAPSFKPYTTSIVPSRDLVVEVSLIPMETAEPVVPVLKKDGKSMTRKNKKKGKKELSKSSRETPPIAKVPPPVPSKPKEKPKPSPPVKKSTSKMKKGSKGTLFSGDFE